MKTHSDLTELAKMSDEFYQYLTWTEVLFYGNNVLREIKFFFDNTAEQELIIRLEDIEQNEPTRRIFFDKIAPDERQRVLQHAVKILNEAGFPTEVLKGTLLKIQRGSAHKKVPHNEVQLENNRLVPLLRRYFRKS